MFKPKKIKRFNFQIIDAIIGMNYEQAQELCLFNGYSIGLKSKFYGIVVETKDGVITKATYYA
jgi:formylmethanofuran dehydrogenase subunit D